MRIRYGRNVGITRPGVVKTMIDMLRALMGKADNMQEQMNSVRREMENSKKESKRNTRDQKHCV